MNTEKGLLGGAIGFVLTGVMFKVLNIKSPNYLILLGAFTGYTIGGNIK